MAGRSASIVEMANVKSAVWAAGHRPGGAVPAGTPQDYRWHLIIIISQSFFRGCQQRRCGQEPAPGRTVHWNVTYNAFKCKDNKWIQMLGLESARHLPGFLAALGLEDSGDHDRLQTTTVVLAGFLFDSRRRTLRGPFR